MCSAASRLMPPSSKARARVSRSVICCLLSQAGAGGHDPAAYRGPRLLVMIALLFWAGFRRKPERRRPFGRIPMNKMTSISIVASAVLVFAGGLRAQQAEMSFFVTSAGSGKGADLGG